jgi:hypothetical protein
MSESKEAVPEVEVLYPPKPGVSKEMREELRKPDKKPIELKEGIDYTEKKN